MGYLVKKEETHRITKACMSPITSGIPPEKLLPSNDLPIQKKISTIIVDMHSQPGRFTLSQ